MPDEKELKQDDLDVWREHPVTRRLLAVLRAGSRSNSENLRAQLWAEGQCDRESLGRVKAAEDLIEDLEEATADEWNEWTEQFGDQANSL